MDMGGGRGRYWLDKVVGMSARPQAHEAAPYYFLYIDQAPGDDATALIGSQLDESLAFFSGISEAQSLYRYAPGKWSIRQVLNHVTDTERAFAFRALWFARGFATPLPSYDQNTAAAGAEADRVSWAAHVEEFRAVRLATHRFLPQSAARGLGPQRHRQRQSIHRASAGLHHRGARCASRQGPPRTILVGRSPNRALTFPQRSKFAPVSANGPWHPPGASPAQAAVPWSGLAVRS
jgi:hypothetical protein